MERHDEKIEWQNREREVEHFEQQENAAKLTIYSTKRLLKFQQKKRNLQYLIAPLGSTRCKIEHEENSITSFFLLFRRIKLFPLCGESGNNLRREILTKRLGDEEKSENPSTYYSSNKYFHYKF